MADMTPADVAAVTNRGYDGYGMDGYGAWFWIIIILFAFWGNNGWGNNRNNEVDIDTRFLERDIFNTNQNVSTTGCQTQRDVLENRYTTQLGLANLGYQTQNCCCETQKEILQNRYDNALQTQTLSSQMANCCCDLRAEGIANTQKILDKLCENEINQLRTDLQSAQLQISQLSQTANITNTLRPYPQPAYITCSPYESAMFGRYGYGFGFNNGCNSCCGC
ncbi:MAG: hypothetical protein ACI4VQ_06400 [Clostridia bacterium]